MEPEQRSPYAAATSAAKSLLDVVRATDALTPDFWHDPFALGFLFSFIHGVAMQANESTKKFDNMPLVYLGICGRDGVEVLERTMIFHMDNNTDFIDGGKAAEKFLSILRGSTVYDGDPVVIGARYRADEIKKRRRRSGGGAGDNVLFAVLLEDLFLTEARRRATGFVPN